MRTNHLIQVRVGATETDVLAHSTYVGFAEKIEGRYLVGDEINPERGLRVRDGLINFTMFRPVPLAQMEDRLYNLPVFKPIYDFDNDGFMDYTYGYRYGSTGWKSADISYAALSAGTIDAAIEGAVNLEIDPVPATISGNSFTLKGRVVSPSLTFLQLHSPVTARTLMQTRGFSFPIERQLGTATLDANGNFQLKVTISPAERAWFVTEHFFVSTPLGTSTVNFLLPALVKKYASCSAMNRDFIGGVAKSADSKNKGAKTRQKPSVSAKVYDLNKSLDKDKDGLVCER